MIQKEKSELTKEIKTKRLVHHNKLKRLTKKINNPTLRFMIYNDLQEVQRNLSAKSWKSACILCGGIIEEVLINRLNQEKPQELEKIFYRNYPKEKYPGIEHLYLTQLINIATGLSIISANFSKLCSGIKDYRDLIHPSVVIRNKVNCSENIAYLAWTFTLEILGSV